MSAHEQRADCGCPMFPDQQGELHTAHIVGICQGYDAIAANSYASVEDFLKPFGLSITFAITNALKAHAERLLLPYLLGRGVSATRKWTPADWQRTANETFGDTDPRI